MKCVVVSFVSVCLRVGVCSCFGFLFWKVSGNDTEFSGCVFLMDPNEAKLCF